MEKDGDYDNDKEKWCQEETKWQDHQDGDAPSPRLVVPPWPVETKGDLTTLGRSPRPREEVPEASAEWTPSGLLSRLPRGREGGNE
ncbi:hypothetical protein H920_10015 [Fukomys damarensis]|uniref:Uncharacterized protein n=1 Tax=Fukomys damarensis TaxID=885580 RepID=A0A091DBX4_FUKDA|nr:hypothetical protein H920_10015 [Fukomys damarensis]